jgi:hypothetical protein
MVVCRILYYILLAFRFPQPQQKTFKNLLMECMHMSYVQKRRVNTSPSRVQYWSTCELFFRCCGKGREWLVFPATPMRHVHIWRTPEYKIKMIPLRTNFKNDKIRLGFTLLTSSRTNQDALSVLLSYCSTVWQYVEREDISTVTWELTSKEWNLIEPIWHPYCTVALHEYSEYYLRVVEDVGYGLRDVKPDTNTGVVRCYSASHESLNVLE